MRLNVEELRDAGFVPFDIENCDVLDRDVFDYLFTIPDQRERTETLVKFREQARKQGKVQDFNQLYKSAEAEFIQNAKQIGSNTVKFTNCPIPDLKCGKWECTDLGVSKQTLVGLSSVKVVACTHPILPAERLVNLDTDTEKIKLSYYKDGRWKDITVDRSVVANKSHAVMLSDRGIEVTSETSKDLVNYISDMVSLNIKSIPAYKSISRLGWINGKFSPYVPGIKYDGDSAYQDLYESVTPCGDFEEWKKLCVDLRKNKTAHLLLASSFASPLIEQFGTLPFIVHVWGGTGVGKTVGLMLAMSVWGNPELGKLVRSLNSTQVALTRTASFLYSVPFAGDELQIIKNRWENFDQLIMTLTEGMDRGRGKAYGGVEELKQWKCCFLFTGEEPITKSASGGGAKNRVIEVECVDKLVEDGNRVSNLLRLNYGHAGKLFIEKLPSKTKLQEEYRNTFKSIVEQCDTTDKQAMAMACVLVADRLASDIIFKDKPLEIKDIKEFLQTTKDVDVSARAYDWVISWIATNQNRFTIADNKGEIWGKISPNGDHCYVLKAILEQYLKEAGFDYNAVIRKWSEKGHIERNSQGKFYHCTKVSGIKGYYTKILINEDIEYEIDDDDVLPI